MRKLILGEWLTVDGYAARENGQLDFFESTELSRESDEDLLAFMETVDTIVLGAKTHVLFADYWPEATSDKEIIPTS